MKMDISSQGDKMKEDVKARLIGERAELHERLEKLRGFIDTPEFYSLDAENRFLLCQQEEAMEQYENILTRRISIDS
jgi:hypothetical protein